MSDAPPQKSSPWHAIVWSRWRGLVAIAALALAGMSLNQAVLASHRSPTALPQITKIAAATPPDLDTPPAEGIGRASALADLRALRVASQVLQYIRQRYVDPDKVQPQIMLEESLQAVAHLVPEMLVDAPNLDAQGQPLTLRVRIGEKSITLQMKDLYDTWRLNWALLGALQFVADHLPPDVPASKVEYTAINGMLSTLDPYSHMLDPDQWREMQTKTGGNFGGLGIAISAQDGVLTVQSVIFDSPARLAGLQPRDQILQIDGEDTLNMTFEAALDKLRGEVGTTAKLQVKRKGWPQPQLLSVVRAVIHLQSVESKVLDNGIGYAKIKNFQRGTAQELVDAVLELQRAGIQNGLVLDLRDNPGGLLDEAIKVVDLFVDSGPAVITVTGGSRQRDERLVSGRGRFVKMPLAVLINGHSASASEVVSGALKYSGRALAVGEQSFGKALVQVPYEIGDGALKLTVAKYLVPGDINIHGVGIAPDIGIEFVSATREQINLFAGPRYSRALKKVRAQMKSQPPPKPPISMRILLPDLQPADARDGIQPDGPVEVKDKEPPQRAGVLLRRAGDVRAKATLNLARSDLADMARADDQALVLHLKKQGIDWRADERAPNPQLRLQIATGDHGLEVAAGEVLRMAVTLTNVGLKPLSRLHILTSCEDPTLDGHEQLVGRLEPGQQRTVNLNIRISMRHADLHIPLRVLAAQDGALLPQADETKVVIVGRAQPDFSFRVVLDDTEPTSATAPPAKPLAARKPATDTAVDGVLQPHEQAQLRVEIQNHGVGAAAATVVNLRSLSGGRLHLAEPQVRLGNLEAGATAVATFALTGGDAAQQAGKAVADFAGASAELIIADEALGVERVEYIDIPWGRKPLGKANAAVAKAVKVAAAKSAQQWNLAPQIVFSPQLASRANAIAPAHDLGDAQGPDGGCAFEVAGIARFDAAAPARRFVTASVAGIKQTYDAGYAKAEVPFRAHLRLDSGLNAVTIQAQAGPRRTADRLLLIHCERLAPKAR